MRVWICTTHEARDITSRLDFTRCHLQPYPNILYISVYALLRVYLFRHLTESYEFKMNNEFNTIINAIDPLNNPIPVSLVFTPKIIPNKNTAISITLKANKNPLIIFILLHNFIKSICVYISCTIFHVKEVCNKYKDCKTDC